MATRRSLPPKGPLPPRKQTMEVDLSWLLPDEHRARASERPRLSVRAPAISPAPGPPVARTSLGPPRRETLEVKLDWLEPEEQARASQRPKLGPPPLSAAPARARPPPLPQAEAHAGQRRAQPPPLPNEAPAPKPRRAHPAPIPREDPPESAGARRRSRHPPKR